MEPISIEQALKEIDKIVLEKYPNYQSQDKTEITKLSYYKAQKQNEMFIKYSYDYYVRKRKEIPESQLADDIINAAVVLSDKMFSFQSEKLMELKRSNLDFYLILIRNKTWCEINKLNYLILCNETIEKIIQSRIFFDNDADYFAYIEDFFRPVSLKYNILTKTRSSQEALERLKSEMIIPNKKKRLLKYSNPWNKKNN